MLTTLFLKCLHADYIHLDSVSYALVHDGASLTILFEDSNGALDWSRNLHFVAREHEGALVHGGFLSAFLAVREILADALSPAHLRRVTVAGYSHGGALATLCHAYAYHARPDLRAHLQTVTYGAPRVYRRAMQDASAVFERLLRVENAGDIVTELPPTSFGFAHVGTPLQIGVQGAESPFRAHTSESYLRALAERGL